MTPNFQDRNTLYISELWGLVNNAGVLEFAECEYYSVDDFCRTIDINLIGQIRMCKAFLPEIRRSSGRIVNVASVLGMYTSLS